MRYNVRSNTVSIEVKTMMSPRIISSATIVRNLDLRTTISIKMPKVQLGGNPGASMHAIIWSAPSHGPPK